MSLPKIARKAIPKVSPNVMFIAQVRCDLRTSNTESILTLTSAAPRLCELHSCEIYAL